MNTISRTITGIFSIFLGLFLIKVSILENFWMLIYGIPILIIGIYILFNKNEDNIEKIKSRKN